MEGSSAERLRVFRVSKTLVFCRLHLGKDSDLMVWVLADRRPDAVEAVGEDGLDKIDADALPCDSQHASTLCQAARLMCSGMHTCRRGSFSDPLRWGGHGWRTGSGGMASSTHTS